MPADLFAHCGPLSLPLSGESYRGKLEAIYIRRHSADIAEQTLPSGFRAQLEAGSGSSRALLGGSLTASGPVQPRPLPLITCLNVKGLNPH